MAELGPRVSPRVPCGSLQVSGVVFFSVETAEHLLATHVSPPLDACTYMGLDSGAEPVQVTKGSNWGPLAGGERLSDLRTVLPPFGISLSTDGTSPAQPNRGIVGPSCCPANSHTSHPHPAVSVFRHPALHGSEYEQGELPGWAAPGDGAR